MGVTPYLDVTGLKDNNIIKNLYNKRACPTKNKPQQGISYLERERKGVCERERGGKG